MSRTFSHEKATNVQHLAGPSCLTLPKHAAATGSKPGRVAKNLESFLIRNLSGNHTAQHQAIVEVLNHVAPREDPSHLQLLCRETLMTIDERPEIC